MLSADCGLEKLKKYDILYMNAGRTIARPVTIKANIKYQQNKLTRERKQITMESVKERFLRYVAINTESAEAAVVPSTECQRDLAVLLAKELRKMGASNVRYDETHCYVYATIPANCETDAPALGFIAHMDTSPAISGANVKARCVPNYDGSDICLNEALDIVLSVNDFPEMKEYVGQELIVTDGTTLLGADDKAGVAEIMTMAEYLLTHPEIPHGTIQIGFTPDEEVGAGVDFFDVEGFGAAYAYTVDGGRLGELEYENFNAAGAKVTIQGCSIHPGSAKDRMVNAILVGMELQSLLPVQQNPAYTEAYEGFYHLDSMSGTVESAKLDYIIRDHDREKFEQKKNMFAAVCDFLNLKYGEGTVNAVIRDSYYNMKEQILPHMELIDNACEAMKKLGITPIITPVRGGTDGARLSYMGLPCPNLCTGGHNCHGKYEFVSVDAMEKIVALLVELAKVR